MTRLSLLVDHFWTSVERRAEMNNFTQEQLSEFANNFFRNVKIQGLIQGNISEADACSLCRKFNSFLNLSPIDGESPTVSCQWYEMVVGCFWNVFIYDCATIHR